MPKKPRQAHIPNQVRKRKVRRDGFTVREDSYLLPDVDSDAAANSTAVGSLGGLAQAPAGPVTTTEAAPRRMGRRLEARTAVAVRTTGQLPVYERAYLVNELRQIAITATALLGLIIVLTLVLR